MLGGLPAADPPTRTAPAAAPGGRSLAGEIRQGLRFVFGHPLLRPLVLAAAAGNLSIQVCQTMLPVVFVQELELPESALGLFFATGGIGVFLGSLSARGSRTASARAGCCGSWASP
ncbi:hypothetical protein ACFQ0T_35955 [Kitasatospora gansuensis]